jgi:hypothetical protein
VPLAERLVNHGQDYILTVCPAAQAARGLREIGRELAEVAQ